MKDILEESIGGVVSIKPLGNMFEEEKSTDLLRIAKELVAKEGEKKLMTKEDLVSSVNEFSTYGPSIYKKHNLADVAKTFVEIAEAAQKHVVDETQDWFDSVTVKRSGKVRKAKLYYLRGLTGKAARIKEKLSKK